ncbi:hypothetical protein WA026_022613 [Henosepilachna vigintioctopunctata]|uniref:RING-type E3 ubiquitin transferase n=1 Tax=Henosepilachna vigintioctopunctata TaxID=420089 RepID=A0AAW1V373_9CUCU
MEKRALTVNWHVSGQVASKQSLSRNFEAMDNSMKIKFTMGTVGQNGELHCSNCKNYLSVGPVMNNTKFGNICGREACASLASLDGVNSFQVLYESVVQFSLFPCRYRNAGCLSEVKWGEVKKHEEGCEYKEFACPFLVNEKECNWTGDISEVLSHAESTHPEREFKNSNRIADVSKSNHEKFFLNIAQNLVLIMIYRGNVKNILNCRVWASDYTRKRLTYQMKFTDATTLVSISTSSRGVGILHPTELEDIVKIDLNTMRNLLQDLSYYDIDFRLDNVEVEIEKLVLPRLVQSKGFTGSSEKNSSLKICNYCTPLTESKSGKYACSNGNFVCEDCLVTKNITGALQLAKTTQNKLSLLFDRQCKNSSRGCNYFGSYFSVGPHHDICSYAEKTCIFCNILVGNLSAHAKERHEIITNSTHNIFQLTPNVSLQRIIHCYGKFFFLELKMNQNGDLTYQVDCAGMNEVKYNYELAFLAVDALYAG